MREDLRWCMDTKDLEHAWEEDYRTADISALPWEAYKPPSQLVRLVREGQIEKGKALDLGCGLGTNSIYLAQQGFQVTGLDIAPTALKHATIRAEKAGVDVDFVRGSAHDLRFPDKEFSLVFDRGCFHHLPPQLRLSYVGNVARVLQDRGKFFLECFSSENPVPAGHGFTPQMIEDIFGKRFTILSRDRAVHTDPRGREITLLVFFMEKA